MRHSFTKELDGDTGLVYMMQRWYFPETGTFVSQDLIGPLIEFPQASPTYPDAVRIGCFHMATIFLITLQAGCPISH